VAIRYGGSGRARMDMIYYSSMMVSGLGGPRVGSDPVRTDAIRSEGVSSFFILSARDEGDGTVSPWGTTGVGIGTASV